EGKRERRSRCRLCTPDLYLRPLRLDRAANAGQKTAAADGGNDGGGIWRIFENLQAHCPMASDEIVIVKRMHERTFDAGIRSIIQSFPGDVAGHRNQLRTQCANPLKLRLRYGLDDNDAAR